MQIKGLNPIVLSQLPVDDIYAFQYAAEGAMGIPGQISLFVKESNEFSFYKGNLYALSENDSVTKTGLTVDDTKNNIGYPSDELEFVYLGMGNYLIIRESIYKSFCRITDGMSPGEMYSSLKRIMEKIFRMHFHVQ